MTWWSDLREHADVAEVWDSQATVFWGLIAVGLFTFWAGIGYAWLVIRFILWLLITILNLLLAISGYQVPLPANTWRDFAVEFFLTAFSHLSINWTIFWIGIVLVGVYTSWEFWPPRISERLLGPWQPPDENYVSPLMQVKANEKQQISVGPGRRASLPKNHNIASPQQRARPRALVTDEDSQIAHVRAGDSLLERLKSRFWNWILYMCAPFLTNIIAFLLLLLPRPQTATLFGLLVLYFINSKTRDIGDYITDGEANISKLPQALWTIIFSTSWLWAFLVAAFLVGASIWGLKNTSLSGFLLFSLFVLKILWLMWRQSFPDFPCIDLPNIITPYWPWYLLATLSGLAFMFIVNTGIATPLVRLQELYDWFQLSINIHSTEKATQAGDGNMQFSPRTKHSPTTPPSSMPRRDFFPRAPDDDGGNDIPAAEKPVPSPKLFLAYVPENDIRKVLRWLLVTSILGTFIVYSFWFAPRRDSEDSSSVSPGMTRLEFPAKIVSPVKPSTPLETSTLDPSGTTRVRKSHPHSVPLHAPPIPTPKTSLESPQTDKKDRPVKSSNKSPRKTLEPPVKFSLRSSGSTKTGSGSSIRGRPSERSRINSSATREGWPVRKKHDHYSDITSASPGTTSIKAPSEAYSVTSSASHKGYTGREEDARSSSTYSTTSKPIPSQAPSKEPSAVSSKKQKGRLSKDKKDKATTKGGWSGNVMLDSETQSAHISSSKKSSGTTSVNTSAKITSKYARISPAPKSLYASDRTEFSPNTRPYPFTEGGSECQSLLCHCCQLIIHPFTFLLKVIFSPITHVIFPILRLILNLGGFYGWLSDPWEIFSPFQDYDIFREFVTALPGDVWGCVSDESCLLSGSMTIFYVGLNTVAIIVLGYVLKLANRVPLIVILGRIAIWLPLSWLAFFFVGWFEIPETLVDKYFVNGWSFMFLILFGLKGLKTGLSLISYFSFNRKIPVPKNPIMGPEDVTIIIPIFKYDATNPHFRDVIISMLRNKPWEIIIVAEDSQAWSAVRRSLDNIGGQWTCYMFRRCHPTRPGLRRAEPAEILHNTRRQMVEYGIRDSQTAITCIADWNAIWPTNFLRNTLAAFEDPVISALGTTQILKRGEGEGGNFFRSLQNFLASVDNERQNFSNTCAHSIDGGISLLSNSTWFARTEILYTLCYRQGLLKESWLDWKTETHPGENYWSSRFFTNGGHSVAWYHPPVIDRPVATIYDKNTTIQKLIRDQRTNWRYILESLYHDAVVWRRYPWSTFSLFWSKFFDNHIFLYASLFVSRYLSGISTFNACALWTLIFLNSFFGRGFVVVWRAWMEYLNPMMDPVTTHRDLLRDVAFWVASGTVWPLVEGAVVYWSLVTCWVIEEVVGNEE